MLDKIYCKPRENLLSQAIVNCLLAKFDINYLSDNFTSDAIKNELLTYFKGKKDIQISNVILKVREIINSKLGFKTLYIICNSNNTLNMEQVISFVSKECSGNYLISVVYDKNFEQNDFIVYYDGEVLINTFN